jgi:hypothetical protein
MRKSISLFLLLFIAAALFSTKGIAQSLKNIRANASGDQVSITYDIDGGGSAQSFSVSIFISSDNFSRPLSMVIGDVGENVTPGPGKTITWNAADETGNYNGEVVFEIRATPVIGSFRFTSDWNNKKIKRGSRVSINWEGGKSDKVELELYKDNNKISTFGQTVNRGSYTWNVPSNLKGGGNYKIKMVGSNPNEEVYTGSFIVKKKVGLVVKMLPLIVAGGAAYVFLGGEAEGPGSKDPDPLPAPTSPTR